MSDAKQTKKPNIILRLLALLVTVALVLGALALVVYRDRLNLDALERWLAYRDLETGETGQAEPFTHAGGDGLSLAFLDKGILFTADTGAHYYSINGELYAEKVLSMDAPVLSAANKSAVVYDAGGQSLFRFQGNQQTMDLTLSGNADVLSARTNDAGWVALTAQQSGFKGAVTVYDAAGTEKIQIKLSSTFVVDAAVAPNNKSVALVTIDQMGGVFNSKVLFYPIDSTEPSATVDLGNQVVLDMDYEDGRLWLLSDDRVLTMDGKGETVSSYGFGHRYLKGYSLKGDGFALLLLSGYETGNADEVLTLNSQCALAGQLALSGQVLDFDCAGSYTALLTGSGLTIYDQLLGTYAQLSDPQGARYVGLRRDGSAALADHQRCWLYIPE